MLVANQAFPATANWNTWTTLTLSQASLSTGAHTLKVWFDTPAGSSQYINLDNLTVVQLSGSPVPVNTALPSITGTTRQGQTLSVSNGTWSTPHSISVSIESLLACVLADRRPRPRVRTALVAGDVRQQQ